MIKIRYSSVDGVVTMRSFSTLASARQYAQCAVGKYPEIGSTYAVSSDGIGKIELLTGPHRLTELFGDEQ